MKLTPTHLATTHLTTHISTFLFLIGRISSISLFLFLDQIISLALSHFFLFLLFSRISFLSSLPSLAALSLPHSHSLSLSPFLSLSLFTLTAESPPHHHDVVSVVFSPPPLSLFLASLLRRRSSLSTARSRRFSRVLFCFHRQTVVLPFSYRFWMFGLSQTISFLVCRRYE